MGKTKWELGQCEFRSCYDMNRGPGGGDNKYAAMCARHYQAVRDIGRCIRERHKDWRHQLIDPVSYRRVIERRYKQLKNHAAGFCASDCRHRVTDALEGLKLATPTNITQQQLWCEVSEPPVGAHEHITPGRLEFESLAEYAERTGTAKVVVH